MKVEEPAQLRTHDFSYPTNAMNHLFPVEKKIIATFQMPSMLTCVSRYTDVDMGFHNGPKAGRVFFLENSVNFDDHFFL